MDDIKKSSFSKGFPRFVLAGYFGFGNLGDDCILEVWLTRLRERFPDAGIAITGPRVLKAADQRRNILWLSRLSLPALSLAVKECHAVIFPGGGLWQDITSSKSLYYYLFLFCLARYYHKPAVLWAQGFGPVRSGINRLLTRHLLRRADLITVRDKRGLAQVEKWFPGAVWTPDPTLSFEPVRPQEPEGSPAVGLSLPFFSGRRLIYLEKLQEYLLQKGYRPVRVIPDGAAPAGDRHGLPAVIWRGDLVEFLNRLSELHLVISARLHPLILSSICGVLSIGLDVDEKIRAWQEMMEMPCLKLDDSHFKELIEKIEVLLSAPRELSLRLIEKTRTMREIEKSQFERLLKYLAGLA